ncbi:MAG: condensation domain-containing protein, partial [Flammeovirgaceae bacterium]
MQEGIYFHFVYDRKASAFFVQLGYRIKGQIDIERVLESLRILHERHEVLRTVFNHEKSGKPLQVVLKRGNVDFQMLDFSDGSGKVPLEKLTAFKNEDKQNLFDLNKDVLMRITLIKLDQHVYEFVWSHHHILMDGWCSTILISEFNA